jgi:hypothetical protein
VENNRIEISCDPRIDALVYPLVALGMALHSVSGGSFYVLDWINPGGANRRVISFAQMAAIMTGIYGGLIHGQDWLGYEIPNDSSKRNLISGPWSLEGTCTRVKQKDTINAYPEVLCDCKRESFQCYMTAHADVP